MKALFLIFVFAATSSCCSRTSSLATINTIHDTIKIRDTVRIKVKEVISDESDIESIAYYKTLSERLFRAVTLVQLNYTESDYELADLNRRIEEDRAKHNRLVTQRTLKELNRIISK